MNDLGSLDLVPEPGDTIYWSAGADDLSITAGGPKKCNFVHDPAKKLWSCAITDDDVNKTYVYNCATNHAGNQIKCTDPTYTPGSHTGPIYDQSYFRNFFVVLPEEIFQYLREELGMLGRSEKAKEAGFVEPPKKSTGVATTSGTPRKSLVSAQQSITALVDCPAPSSTASVYYTLNGTTTQDVVPPLNPGDTILWRADDNGLDLALNPSGNTQDFTYSECHAKAGIEKNTYTCSVASGNPGNSYYYNLSLGTCTSKQSPITVTQ